jgi:hypothetical protein
MNSQPKLRSWFVAIGMFLGLGLTCYVAAAMPQEAANKESAAPATQTVKETGKKGTAGTDQNIKSDSDKNDPNQKVEPPAQKSGKKSRGIGPYACSVHIDNREPWLIRIYVDGVYRGTVNGYGDLIGIVGNGPTTAYGVALFENGTTTTWGPHVFNCGAGGSYTWGLY